MTTESNMLFRSGTLTRAPTEGEGESVYRVSFSSELPVRRYIWGIGEVDEILAHSRDAVDLSFMGSGNAPLLMDHNHRDQIGVIDSVEIEDGRLVGTVRFSPSVRAQEIKADVDANIRSNVSIGYQITRYEHDEEAETFTATRWGPFEGSIVSIPADPTIGVGRSADNPYKLPGYRGAEDPEMEKEKVQPAAPAEPAVDIKAMVQAEKEAERARVKELTALGAQFNLQQDADKFIQNDRSVDEFNGFIVSQMSSNAMAAKTDMGMSKREKKQYSLARLIDAKAGGKSDAGFELEVSDEMARKSRRNPEGVFVPHEMLSTRLLSAGLGTQPAEGGALVPEIHDGSQFIDVLRPYSALPNLGVTTLTGLSAGRYMFPRQTGAETINWLAAENAAAVVSEPAFDQIELTPHDMAVRNQITRRLLMESDPSIEALVRRSVASSLATAVDIAGIGQETLPAGAPTGLLNQAGIPSVSLTTVDYVTVLSMIQTLFASNAAGLGGKAWLMNAAGITAFGNTRIDAGSGRLLMELSGDEEFTMLGYRGRISENMPRTYGAGDNESAVIFGAFSELIMAFWGGVDLIVDPYTNSASGQVNMTLFQTMDVNVKHAEAFVKSEDLA